MNIHRSIGRALLRLIEYIALRVANRSGTDTVPRAGVDDLLKAKRMAERL